MKKTYKIILTLILTYLFSVHGSIIHVLPLLAVEVSTTKSEISDKKPDIGKQKVFSSLKLPKEKPDNKEFVPGEIIVKLKNNVDTFTNADKKLKVKVLGKDNSRKVKKVELPEEVSMDQALAMYEADPNVEYAHPNYTYKKAFVPNDPYYLNTNYNPWHLKKIQAEQAWDITQGDPGVVIAIIDTGVDLNHPDLAMNIAPGGYNFVTPSRPPQDDDGHGTHVAGIAAAVINNSYGVAGLAGKAKILPIKVLDSTGYGSDWNIVQGIRHAISQKAKIINLSLGASSYSPTIKSAIDEAYQSGILVVAATGNDYGGPISYPAQYSNVIAVTATDAKDTLAHFSNFGRQAEVGAPGNLVYSTMWDNTFSYLSGTSMATPLVAGLAALIWSQDSTLENWQVREIIKKSADDLGVTGFDSSYGHGRINAAKALKLDSTQIVKPVNDNTHPDGAYLINNGQKVDSVLSYNYSEHWYKFKVESDSKVGVNLDVPSEMEGAVEIYSEHFKLLQTIDFEDIGVPESGTAYLKAGTYHLLVYDFLDKGQTESYSLQVSSNAFSLPKDKWEGNEDFHYAKQINLNSQINGTFMPSGDKDFYKIYVPEKGKLKLRLEVPSIIDGGIAIFPPYTDMPLAAAYEGYLGETEELSVDITSPGFYYLALGDLWGTPSEEEYVFTTKLTPNRAPELTLNSPMQGFLTKNSSVKVEGTTQWADTLKINGTIVKVEASGAFSLLLDLHEGSKEIVVEAGNTFGTTTINRQVTVDLTPPTLKVTNPGENLLTNNKYLQVAGQTESDVLLTLNAVPVTLDGLGNFSSTLNLSEGLNTFKFEASDKAGNLTKIVRTVNLDTLPPEITVHTVFDGLLTNQSILVLKGVTESGAQLKVNGQGVTLDATGNFTHEIELMEGENQIQVQSTDPAGNSSSKTGKVTLDSKAPELTITSPTNNLPTNSRSLTVKGQAESGTIVRINDVTISTDVMGSFSHIINLADGKNDLIIEATDRAGNKAQKTITVDYLSERISGSSRYETAVQISKLGWPDGAEAVFLARADSFADALAGAPLAYKYNAPILITDSKALTPVSEAEITRLNPKKVYILGGPGAVSTEIENKLKSKYQVIRISGTNRYETAAKIAKEVNPTSGKAILALGLNFPDALATSSLAAYQGMPILLTETDGLPQATKDALRDLNITQTFVAGGKGVITDSLVSQISGAERISGTNRYATAIKVGENLSPNLERIFIATGTNFPDALAGSAFAARTNSPIILVEPGKIPDEAKTFLHSNKANVKSFHVFGGDGVVRPEVVAEIRNLLK